MIQINLNEKKTQRVGRVVRTTIHLFSGVRSLGINPRFPPLQELKVDSTSVITSVLQKFYPGSL